MPMAKQARQIWTKKLTLVHNLPFSGVIFTEIGHLATIPIFWSNQCKKVQIIKHECTPEICKIKLYCIVIILYRMHTDRTVPISKRFLLPNITYILIIHSGPVARTVPIKNHGQDSSTSQLESIRFKYLRLK